MKGKKIYKALMSFMSRFMLSCESAGVLMCIQQQEKLTFRQKVSLRMHLMSCKLCRRFEEDLEHIQTGIDHYKNTSSDSFDHHHLDEGQKRSISQELENQAKNK